MRTRRTEIALVLIIVVVMSAYVRFLYIPPFPDLQVAASEEKYHYDVGDPGPWFSAWSIGDGQAYALIALDPSGKKLDQEITETTYRFARAGYGWLAGALSFGRERLVPYGLALAGALSVIALFVATTAIRSRLGPRAWLIVLNPAVFIAFAGDTSESLAILFLVIALGWGSLSAAVLLGITSPTFLVGLWGRWRLALGGVAAAAALAVYSYLTFGPESFIPAGGRLALPLSAYFHHFSVWGILLASAAAATVWLGVQKRDWSWVVSGFFVLCFGNEVLLDPVNAWRVAGFLPVLWAFGPRWSSRLRSQGGLHPLRTPADVA